MKNFPLLRRIRINKVSGTSTADGRIHEKYRRKVTMEALAFIQNLIEMSKCAPNPSFIILCKVENRISFKFLSNFEI